MEAAPFRSFTPHDLLCDSLYHNPLVYMTTCVILCSLVLSIWVPGLVIAYYGISAYSEQIGPRLCD